MSWTAPLTWVAQNFTAALANTHLRDNLNETAPGKASTAGGFFVATGANAIAERIPTRATVVTSETTASTSYVDLATAGPAVTVTSGALVLVLLSCQLRNNTVNDFSLMSYAISSATTQAADDDQAVLATASTADARYGASQAWLVTVNAGSNVFTAKFRVSGGTGTFERREISVLPF